MISNIEKFQLIIEAATKGPWIEREDHDYYRGGTYLGNGPYKYVRDDSNRLGRTRKVDCDIREAQYFHEDVCLMEGNNEENNIRFIQSSRLLASYFLELWRAAEMQNIDQSSVPMLEALDKLRKVEFP